ncbi:MAG TPA: site-2 protease family protein, partial [Candidatus Nanoarchaeia archaeon]|nr:site-2 protease family protein [Candidatus Nanoarchaeia archaeon]
MSFIVYDLVLLGLFVLAIALFLYRKRHNLKKEGLLYLYRTSWGIKLINKIGKKYTKTLKVLSYVSVGLGYLLTIGVLWLIYNIMEIYFLHPEVVSQIKVPPIMPLIPYIDKVVPFLPPFYFTYWIVILAIVAISHEFAHGIFAAHNKVKIKKTGFGFFPFFAPVFLAAFVELDEKKMVKKKNFAQRAILAAGTFANIVTSLVFLIVLWLFFISAFHPAGVVFDDYSYNVVSVATITMINNVSLSSPTMDEITPILKNATFNEISVGEAKYAGVKGFSNDKEQVALYDDAPAIKNQINGAILEIDGEKVTNSEELGAAIQKHEVGEEVIVKVKLKEDIKEQKIILGENP